MMSRAHIAMDMTLPVGGEGRVEGCGLQNRHYMGEAWLCMDGTPINCLASIMRLAKAPHFVDAAPVKGTKKG
jgi:hypothetical protein